MNVRNIIVVVVAVSAAAVAALVVRGRTSDLPDRRTVLASAPASDDALAVGRLDTDKGIRQFESRVTEDPRDFVSFTVLGQLYARKGRETSDLAYYRRAERAFQQALQRNPDHLPAKAALAAAYASQHRFAVALEIARALYDESSGHFEALGTIADAYLETGQYKEGEDAVKILAGKVGDVPAVLARKALISELRGRRAEAIKSIERAAAAMRRDAEVGSEIAWYEARLGDLYFHQGCLDDSGRHFEASLRLYDNYPVGLTGLADVRAAQGRLDEAVELLRRATAASASPVPHFDLGALYDRMGRPADAKRHYDQAEQIARRADINQAAYYRELASFYADQPNRAAEALEFARKDLEIRKDIEGYDMLAWALYRNKQFTEAAAAVAEAMKLGTEEPGFYYHAGMIHDALGQPDKARKFLEHALKISPHMFPDDAKETLRRLGGDPTVQVPCGS